MKLNDGEGIVSIQLRKAQALGFLSVAFFTFIDLLDFMISI